MGRGSMGGGSTGGAGAPAGGAPAGGAPGGGAGGGGSSTPACPALSDDPINDTTAVLFSYLAPQAPAGCTPTTRRSDRMAVWTCVTTGFNQSAPEALLFFHGNNNWVTVARSSSGGVDVRIPDWLPDRPQQAGVPRSNPKRAAIAKVERAAANYREGCGHHYGLHTLTNPTLVGTHRPLVLIPEVGVLNTHYDGTRDSPFILVSATGASRFPALFDDCASKLTRLRRPGGSEYLPASPAVRFAPPTPGATGGLSRFFLVGHSGGGAPLWRAVREAARYSVPTRVGVFDATYASDGGAIRAFCEAAQAAGRLNTATGSSVVIVHRPADDNGDTQTAAEAIVRGLEHGGRGHPSFRVAHLHSTDANLEHDLHANPIAIVSTHVAHDRIPTDYIPMLLRTTLIP